MLFYILSRLILHRFLGLLGRRTSDQVSAALSELCRILLTDRVLDSAKDPSSSYTGDHFSISDTISIIFKLTFLTAMGSLVHSLRALPLSLFSFFDLGSTCSTLLLPQTSGCKSWSPGISLHPTYDGEVSPPHKAHNVFSLFLSFPSNKIRGSCLTSLVFRLHDSRLFPQSYASSVKSPSLNAPTDHPILRALLVH